MEFDTEKTVLFVDDDQNVLSSLRRLLRREPWHILFAKSAREGLDILQSHRVDLVVSDMRMPEMDGAIFLQTVKNAYPHTGRVILTGYADKHTVASMLQNECAHQMILKPWEADELKAVLYHILNHRETPEDAEDWLQAKLTEVDALPTLPQVYLEIKEVLASADDLSVKRIGEVIEQDPSISVRLLKWANSAMFGQRNRVDHIQRAIVVLGMEMVQGLVLSMSVFDVLKPGTSAPAGYSRDGFWQHSLASGFAARWISREMGLGDAMSDKVFTAGLLHDLGKLFEDCYLHDDFVEAVALAQTEQMSLWAAEQKVMNTNHMETGAYLAEWWDLSPVLAGAMRWHHKPKMMRQKEDVVGIVHMANVLVQQFGMGMSGNFEVPRMDSSVRQKLNLSDNRLAALETHVRQIGS